MNDPKPIAFFQSRRAAAPAQFDSRGLAADLRRAVQGEVRFDAGSRALYATDGSNYRQVPIGVVIPKSVDDVVATVALCRSHDVPVLARGAGTSLCGQCCNVAVVMDFSKYLNRIIELDPERRRARVEPGVVLDNLRGAAERHRLTFAPDPSTHSHNTLGGMIGNNSCGVHSVMGGRTSDNAIELDVLTYDGERLRVGATGDAELQRRIAAGGRSGAIYSKLQGLRDRYAEQIRSRYPRIPRRVSGYALDELLPENGFNVARALVGSEGTCVTVLAATLRLVDSPPGRSLLVLGYPDVYQAGDHVMEILEHQPIGLEGIDDRLVDDMKTIGLHPRNVALLPPGGGWLLAEFGGADDAESQARARACMAALERAAHPPSMKLFDDREQQRQVWKVREAGLGATAHVPHKPVTWEGWEDAAVPPQKVGAYMREFRALLDRYGYACDLYGHFGQGCIHTRIDFDLQTRAGIDKFHAFLGDAADLVVRYGGSISGEHGDGQAKAEFLSRMYGEELVQAFREFKAIWDPQWKMNPGKVVDAYRADENLRLGAEYSPPQVATRFKYPNDAGDFNRVMLRCVGIGNCRREHGQTMCPSYRVTREERHSTRGRARLLFEMLRGDVLQGGWRDEHVKEALDLCLSCKGCKGECPVQVDMATYKAEFMAHHYAGRIRPRGAYAFGFIDSWLRLAALAPGVANFVTQTPLLRDAAKAGAGVARERSIPRIAPQTFVDWFHRRGPRNAGKKRVILWPDTFNNYFHPETARAAVDVLEHAGFRVHVPLAPLCCGRPLYEFGMLDRARAKLERVLSALRHEIDAGVPLVALEPACASVFRDELTNLLHGDTRAKRLAEQTYFFDEFVDRLDDPRLPRLERKALVHAHCHQKALLSAAAGKHVLARLGVDFQILDSGCCGMSGSFGFEREKRAVSEQIGELVLLPAVREASPDTLIVADGFSCREQIAQCTPRRALHLAQVMQLPLHQDALPARHEPAESEVERSRARAQRALAQRTALIAGALVLAGITLRRARQTLIA